MIRRRLEQEKKKEIVEEERKKEADGTSEIASECNNNNDDSKKSGGLSLLGVGGKQVNDKKQRVTKKQTPGDIRIQRDIAELDCGPNMNVIFPDPNKLSNFKVSVKPDYGFWSGATYVFDFSISSQYPHKAPKVLCETKIFHPNIDFQGHVCLNILREDWKPVLEINSILFGLHSLFTDPESNQPLNKIAADLLVKDKAQFETVVKRTLQGYSHAGESFPKLI